MSSINSFRLIKELFTERTLRFVLLIFIVIIVSLVSINLFYIYPSFKRVLIQRTEGEAIRIGQHLSPEFQEQLRDTSNINILPKNRLKIQEILNNFGIHKIKLFDRSGLTVLSSEESDVGKINKNDYFNDIAKGDVVTKVVRKNTKSLEGEILYLDIIETYVPIKQGSSFLGAVEIYYDVTSSIAIMNKQLFISSFLLLGVSLLLMLIVLIPLKKLSKITLQNKDDKKKLVESERNLTGLIDGVSGIILKFDRNGIITFINQYGLEYFGYQTNEILGRHLSKILYSDNFHTSKSQGHFVENIFQNHEGYANHENENFLKNGQKTWVAWTNSPIRNSSGEIDEILCVGIDISARRLAEIKLKETHENTQKILGEMPFGVILVGRNRIIRSANKAAISMMGLENESQVVGQICHNRICPAKECECPILDLGQSIDSAERILIGKNKKKIPIMKTVLAINFNGEDLLLEAFVDITESTLAKYEIEQTNKKLQKAIKKAELLTIEAEGANKSKSQFLANMSHEIRTPMNGVIGMAELLKMTHLDEVQMDYANTLLTSGNSLLKIINDILDHAKIEERKLDLEIINFDLRVTLDELSGIVGPMVETKQIEYINDISPEITSKLKGDPGRLRQILINFVGNAIKFTNRGEVVTKVRIQEENDNNCKLFFSIQDTGIGISKDQIDRLFKPFSQADSSTTRKYGGTGLGLIISKQLIEKMGGQVGVKSIPGKGTEFWFTARFETQAKAKGSPLKISKSIKGKKVFIVDDNQTNRLVLSEELKCWKCHYDDASNGYDALCKLNKAASEKDPFDIVLINMQMPHMNGSDLGKQIKETPGLKKIKMVMMTSIGKRGDASKYEKLGFDAYLIKPVKQAKLLSCLKVLSGNNPQGSSQQSQPIITQYSVAEIEKEQVQILLVEDNRINQKVAINFIKKLGYRAELANNGKQAIQKLRDTRYSLIFMDCQMPEMDGYSATKYIRDKNTDVLDHGVPIIAMTANALTGDRKKSLDAGMNDHLTKPVNPKQIFEMINKWSIKQREIQ
jgi:two-component system sensor histidine kinase/response regulator